MSEMDEKTRACTAEGNAVDKDRPVASDEYDAHWIEETWGWDTPESFIKTRGANLRPRILASLELADMKPGMRILDVGCGRGEVVLYCARQGVHAVGIDYSREAIGLAEKARAAHSPEEQEHMRFICDDIKTLAFEASFDRIFMLDLVEHLHDWELLELFAVCRKLLKPGGALIIHTLPNRWLYEITYRRIVRLFMPWLPENPRSQKEMAIHINEMTITHLKRVLDRGGFLSEVWLQELLVEQARWHSHQPLHDRRGKLYQWLCKPLIGYVYRMLAATPLRLLIVNEMFAVAWKRGFPRPIKVPSRLAERLLIKLSSRKHSHE